MFGRFFSGLAGWVVGSGSAEPKAALPEGQNRLENFYKYLEERKTQCADLIGTWERHIETITGLEQPKECTEQDESCPEETKSIAESSFKLIWDSIKRAFMSEEAYFTQQLDEANVDIAKLRSHIETLIARYKECKDEEERKEVAIHMSAAQIYLLRKLQDVMQSIAESLKSAVAAERRLEVVGGFVLNLFCNLVLDPDFSKQYENFLDREVEAEQLRLKLLAAKVVGISNEGEKVAKDAEDVVSELPKRNPSASNLGLFQKLEAAKEAKPEEMLRLSPAKN